MDHRESDSLRDGLAASARVQARLMEPRRWYRSRLFWFGGFWFATLEAWWVSAMSGGFMLLRSVGDQVFGVESSSQTMVVISIGPDPTLRGVGFIWESPSTELRAEKESQGLDWPPPWRRDPSYDDFYAVSLTYVAFWFLAVVVLGVWILGTIWWQRRKWRLYREGMPEQ